MGANGMDTLTAQDIGQHIQQPRESLTAAVDRFRNWTKMGLIKPTGERHPGTGHKKRYAKAVLLEAVLMQSLLDYRPAGELAGIVKGILIVIEHGGEFSFNEGSSRYTVELKGASLKISTSQNPHSWMVLNLKPMFANYRLNVEDFPAVARLFKKPKS
jgi:hypothetical protein